MTEHIAALDALIEAVEAGKIDDDSFCPLFHAKGLCREAVNAFHGSLDAAKALHEALVPGWSCRLTQLLDVSESGDYIGVSQDWTVEMSKFAANGGGPDVDAPAGDPARGYLICILKAYRAGL